MFNKLRAPYVYGSALGSFIRGDYREALRLFEKACRLDGTLRNGAHCNSVIGRCHLALGQPKIAIEFLSNARDLLSRGQSGVDEQDVLATLTGLRDALRAVGQLERAQQVDRELRTRQGDGRKR